MQLTRILAAAGMAATVIVSMTIQNTTALHSAYHLTNTTLTSLPQSGPTPPSHPLNNTLHRRDDCNSNKPPLCPLYTRPLKHAMHCRRRCEDWKTGLSHAFYHFYYDFEISWLPDGLDRNALQASIAQQCEGRHLEHAKFKRRWRKQKSWSFMFTIEMTREAEHCVHRGMQAVLPFVAPTCELSDWHLRDRPLCRTMIGGGG